MRDSLCSALSLSNETLNEDHKTVEKKTQNAVHSTGTRSTVKGHLLIYAVNHKQNFGLTAHLCSYFSTTVSTTFSSHPTFSRLKAPSEVAEKLTAQSYKV